MFNSIRNNKAAVYLFTLLAYNALVLAPIRTMAVNFSNLPGVVVSLSGIGFGSSVFFSPALYAQEKTAEDIGNATSSNQSSGKYSSEKEAAGGIGGDTSSSVGAGLSEKVGEFTEYIFGDEEDREFSDMLQVPSWDDATTKAQGAIYESVIRSNKATPEGQVYDVLNGVSNNEKYHTRDRDNQEFGDRATLTDIDEDDDYLKLFEQTSKEMEEGLICTTEIVEPAVYSYNELVTSNNCTVNTGDSWIEGECTLSRSIDIPMLIGEGFSSEISVSGGTRKFESLDKEEHSFSIDMKDSFIGGLTFEVTDDYPETAEFEVVLNDQSIPIESSEVSEYGFSVGMAHVSEGTLNTVRVNMHPEGFSSGDGSKACGTSEYVYVGSIDRTFSKRGGGPVMGISFPYHWSHTRILKNIYCQDGVMTATRLRIAVSRVASSSVPSYYTGDDFQNVIQDWLAFSNDSSNVSQCTDVLTTIDNAEVTDSLGSISSDQVKINCETRDISGEEYFTYDVSETSFDPTTDLNCMLYNITCEAIPSEDPFYCIDQECYFGEESFSRTGFESVKFNLTLRSSSFVVSDLNESIENCAAKQNLSLIRPDGSIVSGLNSITLPSDTPIPSTDLVSNSEWECLDSDSERAAGLFSTSIAKASEIGNALPELFPGIRNTDKQICYKAKAKKYVVDISYAPLCSDGSLLCYLESELDPEAREGTADTSLGTVRSFLRNGKSCNQFSSDSSCEISEESCSYTSPITGDCLQKQVVYSCKETEQILVTPAKTKQVCESSFPCFGEEDEYCTYVEERSGSFGDAALNLSLSTFMRGDQECLGDDPGSCSTFKGEQKSCRSAVLFGAETCCSDPGQFTTADVINSLYAAYKIDYVESTVDGLTKQYLIDPAMNTVYDPYVKPVVDSAMGAFKPYIEEPWEAVKAAKDNFVSALGGVARQKGEEMVKDGVVNTAEWSTSNFLANEIATLGAEHLGFVGELLFQEVLRDEATGEVLGYVGQDGAVSMLNGATYASQEAANQALSQSGTSAIAGFGPSQTLSAIFSGIMVAYQVYAIAKLIYSFLTACEANEIETASDVAVKNCSFVGEYCTNDASPFGCVEKTSYYCCFGSPLARIVHEQAIKTNQHPFSSMYDLYYSGSCRGLTFFEIKEIDFNAPGFSLDEWVGMLMDVNKMPKPDNLEEFFNEDNITKSVARAYEKEGEVDNATDRATELVTAMDDIEEIRRLQREFLLSREKFDSFWRSCGYIHSLGGGASFDAREEYVNYPDGRQVVVTSCERDPGGVMYPHEYSQCAPRVESVFDEVTGEQTGVINHPRWSVYFTGANGERVELETCSEAAEINVAANQGTGEWVFCGYDHRVSSGVSQEKLKLVSQAGDVIVGCTVQPQSRVFEHSDTPCGFSIGALTADGTTKQKWSQAFIGVDGEVVEATNCEVRSSFADYSHEWRFCSYQHDLAAKQSVEAYRLVFDDFNGTEHTLVACGVQTFSKSFEHFAEACDDLRHDINNNRSYRQAKRYFVTESGRIDISDCSVQRDFIDEEFPHLFSVCGYEDDIESGVTRTLLQRYVMVDGERVDIGQCGFIDGRSPTYQHYYSDCGDYSHDFNKAVSRIDRALRVDLPSGTKTLSACTSDNSIEFEHQYEQCEPVRYCSKTFWGMCVGWITTTPITSYFYRTDLDNERVNARICYYSNR